MAHVTCLQLQIKELLMIVFNVSIIAVIVQRTEI